MVASAVPRLSLPLTRRRLAPSAVASLLAHAVIIAAVVWRGAVHGPDRGREGGNSAGRGAGGSPRVVNFLALAAPAPAAVDVPVPPRVQLAPAQLPPLAQIKLDLPPVALPPDSAAAGGGLRTGSAAGPGMGGGDDYIFVASPRTAILPPLAKAPGSVAGRTYRIRFWVAADGRVTRVDIDPPIRDDAYRREFVERMMAYQFYPARTRDGMNMASVVTISLRIGT